MLFVLSGPSYVGKKTAIAHFMKLYSFLSVIPYTTKPIDHRVGETEGIQYHYVEEEAKKDIENDNFIYDRPFEFGEYKETTLYAYKKSDILNAIKSYSNFIIHASVGNVEKMYNEFSMYHKKTQSNDITWNQQIYFIFLNFRSELTPIFFQQKQPGSKEINVVKNKPVIKGGLFDSLKKEHQKKKDDDDLIEGSNSFSRRLQHAKKEVQYYNEHKDMFDSSVSSDKAYEICRELEKVILPKLKVMPTSPDKIPGPLSNQDIIYVCEKRKHDPMKVFIAGKRATANEIETLLCGCGMHISLSNHIRIIKRNIISTYIDMADDANVIEIKLDKTYPDMAINNGYTLRPHEIILCSSAEAIKLPQDIYAMVVSKFSYTQLGLSIELSPNIIQSGHQGKIHFQIKNNTDNYICIYPNIQIAQLLFFRTIQPSTKVYYEDNNHAYDREQLSPLSKFRDNNVVLDRAPKPRSGIIKKILFILKEKWIAFVAGILVLGLFALFGGTQLYEMLQTYVVPLGENLPAVKYVLLFAVASCVVNNIVYILGICALCVAQRIKLLIHNVSRGND